MLGGLQCQVRRVDEVTRGVTNRDEYEKVARDIRYAFYKQCMAQASAATDSGEDNSDINNANNSKINKVVLSGVIFGHHEGDVQENVISNVMRYQNILICMHMWSSFVTDQLSYKLSHTHIYRGSGPLQLSGMSDVSITNGVPVWRPLLDHNKDEIYDFAHR